MCSPAPIVDGDHIRGMLRYSDAVAVFPFFGCCCIDVKAGHGGGHRGCMRASQAASACALKACTSGMHDLRHCKHTQFSLQIHLLRTIFTASLTMIFFNSAIPQSPRPKGSQLVSTLDAMPQSTFLSPHGILGCSLTKQPRCTIIIRRLRSEELILPKDSLGLLKEGI